MGLYRVVLLLCSCRYYGVSRDGEPGLPKGGAPVIGFAVRDAPLYSSLSPSPHNSTAQRIGHDTQVKRRAAQEHGQTSTSMIYLANALREIRKASASILSSCPPILVDGALHRVAKVDFHRDTLSRQRVIRVRVHSA